LSDTDLRTCYELNLSVPAWKGGLVLFGTAGYAWVPESLRSSHRGKHVMAEPVLCLGWQDITRQILGSENDILVLPRFAIQLVNLISVGR
jgi:hypothetical protein